MAQELNRAGRNAFKPFRPRWSEPTCGFVDTRIEPPVHLLLRAACEPRQNPRRNPEVSVRTDSLAQTSCPES